ncbi:MAG: hypothetical protein HOI53_07115 [Francisellaceae bacterium]|jgi:hypothetical protein|nr:hypothetical protein [Francisellaceae bacterium]
MLDSDEAQELIKYIYSRHSEFISRFSEIRDCSELESLKQIIDTGRFHVADREMDMINEANGDPECHPRLKLISKVVVECLVLLKQNINIEPDNAKEISKQATEIITTSLKNAQTNKVNSIENFLD